MASARRATTAPSKGLEETGSPRSRRRSLLLAGALAALALVVVAALAAGSAGRGPVTAPVGEAAVGFELENVRPGGPPVSLTDYRGRLVVLNFFASWCAPCRQEMPGFQAVNVRLGARVAFVGVNHQDARSPALDLLEETGVTYPSGFDPRGSVAAAYGLYGMPTTLFISPEGRVVERRTGEMSERELEGTLRRLLGSQHPGRGAGRAGARLDLPLAAPG